MKTSITNDADIDSLAAAFNNATLPLEGFHHYEHLAVALWHCRRFPEKEAFPNFRAALLRLLAANGQTDAYHETITAFWFELILRFAHNYPPESPLISILGHLPLAYANSQYIYKYFTKKQLSNPQAKTVSLYFQFEL
jgi:hypothetical protein